MSFRENIIKIAEKIKKDKSKITDETNARVIFVEPFLDTLGFDTKDIEVVEREFGADYKAKGTQKKADYAIKKDRKTIIIIEAKKLNTALDKVDLAQLKGYFSALNEVGGDKTKIAMLTNCSKYAFFTELKAKNQMDPKPFFVFDFENFSDRDLKNLEFFREKNFDIKRIKDFAKANIKFQEVQNKLAELSKHNENGKNSNTTNPTQNNAKPSKNSRDFGELYREIYGENLPENYLGEGMDKFLKGEIYTLFMAINECILKEIGGEIELKKFYATYKIQKRNFTSIEPYKNHLKIGFHIEKNELKDPQKIVQDIGDKGHHGTFKSFAILKDESEIPYILGLIKQSFEKVSAKKSVNLEQK